MTETTYKMTASQRRALNDFLNFARYTERHEVKSIKITDSYGDAYVDVTIGRKNDEGTLAEVLCRDTYLFFIGRRGGMYQFGEGMSCKKLYRKYYEVKSLQ